MAFYNYKHVRNQIPSAFQEPWEKKWKEETGRDYEGTCDYDSELWILASDYIDHLHAKIKTLEEAKPAQLEAVGGSIVIPPGRGEATREGLHRALDRIVAAWIGTWQSGELRSLRTASIMDLMMWAGEWRKEPGGQ